MPTVSVKKLNPNGSISPTTEAVVDIETGSSLWEALNNKGFQIPSGCLNGACCACRVEIINGDHSLAPMGPTETDTLNRYKQNAAGKPEGEKIEGKILRLSCQAKVVGDSPITIAKLT